MAATWPSMTGRSDAGARAAAEPPPGPSAGIAAASDGPLAGLPDGARRVLAGIRARGGRTHPEFDVVDYVFARRWEDPGAHFHRWPQAAPARAAAHIG